VIGTDIGKNPFHVVGHDQRGAIVVRQKWSYRSGLEGVSQVSQVRLRITKRRNTLQTVLIRRSWTQSGMGAPKSTNSC
jgi:hypothetical protein